MLSPVQGLGGMVQMGRIRVMIVDDHPCVVQGVEACLRTIKQILVIGHALNGIDAISEAKRLIPDVVLMDLSLPRLGGIGAIKVIRGTLPHTRLIAFTMNEDLEMVQKAAAAGASGYVLKSSPLSVLVKAIKTVQAGGTFFQATIPRYGRGGLVVDESRNNTKSEENQAYVPDFVREATQYIEKHLSPSLTIKAIACVVGKHPSELDRMFSRAKSLTIKQYIDKLCKGEVERRLRSGDTKGSQIALELGFRDDQAFYRWIRRVFGIPFRELQQEYLGLPLDMEQINCSIRQT